MTNHATAPAVAPEQGGGLAEELAYRLHQQQLTAEYGRFALRTRDAAALLQEATRVCALGLQSEFCKAMEYLPDEGQFIVRAGRLIQAVQFPSDRFCQRLLNQRTLPGTADSGHDRQRAERDSEMHVAQVVMPCAEQFEPAGGVKRGRRGEGERGRGTLALLRFLPLSPSPPLPL